MRRVKFLFSAFVLNFLFASASISATTGHEIAHGATRAAACRDAGKAADTKAQSAVEYEKLKANSNAKRPKITVEKCECDESKSKSVDAARLNIMPWSCSVAWGIQFD